MRCAAAHQRRDRRYRGIKPERLSCSGPDGYVKVLDFGIAKLAESAFAGATADGAESIDTRRFANLGSILGTARYMSPEQACGAPVDKSTDIWSLGVVVYEMVTGHAPFTGDTPQEVMSAILESEPPPLTRYVGHLPAELQQIIGKTLRTDREERYYNVLELLEALKGLRRNLEFESFFEWLRSRKGGSRYIIAAAGIFARSAGWLATALLLILLLAARVYWRSFSYCHPQGFATPTAALAANTSSRAAVRNASKEPNAEYLSEEFLRR